MKSKVNLSGYAVALTVSITVMLAGACAASFQEKSIFYTLLALLLIMTVTSMIYAPLSVKASPDCVTVVSLLRRKRIPVSEMESVQLFKPTMGAVRVAASGGYMGYWGVFREGDIGRYTAYYGKASDCFLIRLRDGGQYLLGCHNPEAMCEYIASNIKSDNKSDNKSNLR